MDNARTLAVLLTLTSWNEFAIIATDGKFMVYINNPGCPVDADGCPIFTKEHPQQQWVFGYYESFNRALNRAVAITKARKYPKPIEIW